MCGRLKTRFLRFGISVACCKYMFGTCLDLDGAYEGARRSESYLCAGAGILGYTLVMF
jgi:hypothetical protein